MTDQLKPLEWNYVPPEDDPYYNPMKISPEVQARLDKRWETSRKAIDPIVKRFPRLEQPEGALRQIVDGTYELGAGAGIELGILGLGYAARSALGLSGKDSFNGSSNRNLPVPSNISRPRSIDITPLVIPPTVGLKYLGAEAYKHYYGPINPSVEAQGLLFSFLPGVNKLTLSGAHKILNGVGQVIHPN